MEKLKSISEYTKQNPQMDMLKKPAPQFKKLEPIYIKKLYEKYKGNGTEVARRLMCAGSLINTAVRENTVYAAYELAAKGVWLSEYEPKPEPVKITAKNTVDVFIRCPKDKLMSLDLSLNNLGIDSVVLPE